MKLSFVSVNTKLNGHLFTTLKYLIPAKLMLRLLFATIFFGITCRPSSDVFLLFIAPLHPVDFLTDVSHVRTRSAVETLFESLLPSAYILSRTATQFINAYKLALKFCSGKCEVPKSSHEKCSSTEVDLTSSEL